MWRNHEAHIYIWSDSQPLFPGESGVDQLVEIIKVILLLDLAISSYLL